MQIGKYTLVETSVFNDLKDENLCLKNDVSYYKEWLKDVEAGNGGFARYEKMLRLLTKFYIMVICLLVAVLLIRYYIKNS